MKPFPFVVLKEMDRDKNIYYIRVNKVARLRYCNSVRVSFIK